MITIRTRRGGRHKAEPTRGNRQRATVVVAGTAIAVLAGGGAAFAYWTTTGTGSGSASASTMAAPSISVGDTITGELYPGSTGGTLAVTASNPNPFPITVVLNSSSSATGCTTPAISFSGGSFTLAANASSVTKLVPNSVSMGTNASNDCQGKALTVALTTSSTSN